MRSRRVYGAVGGLIAAITLLAGASLISARTRQGVTYPGGEGILTEHALPLYAKVLHFVDRDVNYRGLARAISVGRHSEEERVLAVFDWTRRNIRDVPDGVPVIDDHVWHIIVRGYGTRDQKADVFTTLTAYAGVPAYWIYRDSPRGQLILSLVSLDGRRRVFEVQEGRAFRRATGEFLSVEELAAEPGLAGPRYAPYFEGFEVTSPPEPLRPEMQMTGARIAFETRRLLGFAPPR